MRNYYKLTFGFEDGLHARVAAMIVKKANDLQQKYGNKLFIGVDKDNMLPANNVISVSSLAIREQEEYYIMSMGEDSLTPLKEFRKFLKEDFKLNKKKNLNYIDTILQEATITVDKVFNNLANGILIINEEGIVIEFNDAAEEITGLKSGEIVGEKVKNAIPNTRLDKVMKSGKKEIGQKQKIDDETYIVTNRAPIIHRDKIIGALAIFQDISTIKQLSNELKETKTLKKKLELILETVHESICFISNEGKINYFNSRFKELFFDEDIKNLNNKDILLNIVKKKELKNVLENGENIIGKINKNKDNMTIYSSIYPILVEDKIEGAVIVSREQKEIEKMAKKLEQLNAKAKYLENELYKSKEIDGAFNKIKGNSKKSKEALVTANKAAKSNSTVLIRGESGTGKELVAEAIHYASSRKDNPLIKVNCAAIPTNLLESELFGHEKGAFTGAHTRKLGKFELADKGTIFLDEIGELPLMMQTKLLRFLEDQTFERVGGTEMLDVDVRIIAATNRNLEDLLEKRKFREDLYYRLNVLPVFLPTLRERKEDIPLLVEHFIEKISKKMGREKLKISQKALNLLINYSWPGNVRELENIVERLLNFTESRVIKIKDLPDYIKSKSNKRKSLINLNENQELATIEEYEREIIKKALKKYGSFNAAGKKLGITHKTVAAKARKYNLRD